MASWVFLLVIAALAAGACSLEPEKQWYKPSASYTVADFERDQKACTRNKQLDEECLKQRGWIPLSGDVAPPAKASETERRARPTGRY